MGNELSHQHINMAQNLLETQFPQFNGFHTTLLQGKELQPANMKNKSKIQIIHCTNQHHWIVATTVNCENGQILVIDSIYKSLDEETKGTIYRLFQSAATPPVIKVVNPQRQKGDEDCGLFAIAFARAVTFDQEPKRKDLSKNQCGPILLHVFNKTK